jgi:hypothetical protein
MLRMGAIASSTLMEHFSTLRGLISCSYLTIRQRQNSERIVIASDAKSSDEHMREKAKHINGGEILDNVRWERTARLFINGGHYDARFIRRNTDFDQC